MKKLDENVSQHNTLEDERRDEHGDTCKLNVSVCELIVRRATPGFTQPKVRSTVSCKIISAKLGRTEREGEK